MQIFKILPVKPSVSVDDIVFLFGIILPADTAVTAAGYQEKAHTQG
jgi:hypothetical protein